MSLIPYSNENFYEISWAAQARIFASFLEQKDDVYGALDRFVHFGLTNTFDLGMAKEIDPSSGKEVPFLTGEVRIAPAPSDDAERRARRLIRDQTDRMALAARLVTAETEAVIELGCGYGLNLLRLARALGDRPIRYVGAEYTAAGRRLFAELATRLGLPFQCEFVDHKSLELSFARGWSDVLVMTCHSIEQVARLPDDYFRTLAGAAPRVVGLHLEPFGFQAGATSPARVAQEATFRKKGFNLNFFECLTRAEREGTIALRQVTLERFVGDLGNPTSVAIWENAPRPAAS